MVAAISIAWLADGVTSYSMSVIEFTWDWLADRPEWQDWISTHVPDEAFVSVMFEDREKARGLVRRNRAGEPSITYYQPYRDVEAAREAHTLPSIAAEVFRNTYNAWAKNQRLPAPPRIDDADLPPVSSRLP